MPKLSKRIFLFGLTILGLALPLLVATAGEDRSGDEAAIRAARSDYNAALASRNADAISKYWMEDGSSVWAGGNLTVGHDAIIARYANTFHGDRFVSGLRTPQEIKFSTIMGRPSASESGIWEWHMRIDGKPATAKGRYLAMWIKTAGQWQVKSDLYVEAD